MTLPKGYKNATDTRKRLRPSSEQLSRVMIDVGMLKTPVYQMKVVSTSFGELDKNLKLVELHPPEWNAKLVLSDGKSGQGVGMPIGDVIDIHRVSESKGTFRKKEDLMVKIVYKGIDGLEYWMIINLDDKDIDNFLQTMETIKQKEFDEMYWTDRSLNFLTAHGQAKTIDIYPLTPFLAEGEEIVWQNIKTDNSSFKDKKIVVWIDVVTNYRAFHYSYEQHTGTVILWPSLEDIIVTNTRPSSTANPIGNYSQSSYYSSGIGNATMMGDIIFFAEGKPFITFTQISDPERLASVVKTLKQQQRAMQIGGRTQTQSEVVSKSEPQSMLKAQPTNVDTSVNCAKCGNNNFAGSMFCNKCGSKLPSLCSKCGTSNPSDSSFCNQCGSRFSSEI